MGQSIWLASVHIGSWNIAFFGILQHSSCVLIATAMWGEPRSFHVAAGISHYYSNVMQEPSLKGDSKETPDMAWELTAERKSIRNSTGLA